MPGRCKLSQLDAARDGKEDDALLFIESMPRRRRRALYVKRVLDLSLDVPPPAWARRDRRLDETAAGGWPIYHAAARSPPPPPPPAVQRRADDTVDAAMPGIDESIAFVPVRIAVMTVSDTREPRNDTSGDTLAARITDAGHVLAARTHRADDQAQIAAQLRSLDRRSGRSTS